MTNNISLSLYNEFLLNLLTEDQNSSHINFLDCNDTTTYGFASLIISFNISNIFSDIKQNFTNTEKFTDLYLNCCIDAMEKYHKLTNSISRHVYIDEYILNYPQKYTKHICHNLLSDKLSATIAYQIIDKCILNKSAAIVIRHDTDIAISVIYNDNNNFIVIDPHLNVCGILSIDRMIRFLTYDNTFDTSISILTFESTQNSTVDN